MHFVNCKTVHCYSCKNVFLALQILPVRVSEMWLGWCEAENLILFFVVITNSIMLLSQDYQDVRCDSDDVRIVRWRAGEIWEWGKASGRSSGLCQLDCFSFSSSSSLSYHSSSSCKLYPNSLTSRQKIVFYWKCKHWNCGYHTFVESSPNSRICFSRF